MYPSFPLPLSLLPSLSLSLPPSFPLFLSLSLPLLVHNLHRELPLVRDKGTIAGTLPVELNDLCFELTDEERDAIGGRAQTSDTPSTDPRESGGEGTSGGGQQVAVSGLTNRSLLISSRIVCSSVVSSPFVYMLVHALSTHPMCTCACKCK